MNGAQDEDNYLRTVQIATLLRSIEGSSPALHLFFLLSATTGARRGERLGLRWADVDLETGDLAIQRAYMEGLTGPVLAPTKTRRSHRVTSMVRVCWRFGSSPPMKASTARACIDSSSPIARTVIRPGSRTG